MNKQALIEKIESAIKSAQDNSEYWNFGIRFENKARQVGEIIEDKSRHGGDECDNREFPEFGTDAYDAMAFFDGVSAYNTQSNWKRILFNTYSDQFITDATHCYLIGSDNSSNQDNGLDDGEIVLVDAEVLAVIF